MTIREQIIRAKQAELLTVKEYADLTGTNIYVVYRRCREGRQLGAEQHGARWLINTAVAPPRSPRAIMEKS